MMKLYKLTTTICLILACLIFGNQLIAQDKNDNALFFNIKYGIQFPGGDLADRFGTHFTAGIDPELYLANGHWFLGLQGNFIFGSDVKENVLAGIQTSEEQIIGNDMLFAEVIMRQRGLNFGGHVGKLFAFNSENNHTHGLRLTMGAGLIMHRIAFKDDRNSALQLRGDYAKGYNRKAVGAYTHQFIGYQFLSADRRLNFRAGFVFHQGFTSSVRSTDFDTKMKEEGNRLDLMNGFEVGWILPIFFTKRETRFYF
ncbi:MAG: hypothetical protein EA362_07885 [Saprospirales bacterium]|nr:MAG: hypothetical protein EA362_07885 [Saprospirales bacterium]